MPRIALDAALRDTERRRVAEAISRNCRTVRGIADYLGISSSRTFRLLKEFCTHTDRGWVMKEGDDGR